MSSDRPRVLFLEARNSARSQLAEAIVRAYAGRSLEACSAGLEPGEIHPLTSVVLREIGIDPVALRPKSVREFLAKLPVRWAIIVGGANERDAPRCYPFAGITLRWPCPDPVRMAASPEEEIEAFRAVRDHLAGCIRAWLEELQRRGPMEEVRAGHHA